MHLITYFTFFNRFVHCLVLVIVFRQTVRLCTFCCVQVFLGVTPSFLLSSRRHKLLLFALQGLCACNTVLRCSLCVVLSFLVDFLTLFVWLFFVLILYRLNQFEFAGFDVFLRCYIYSAFCFFLYIDTKNRAAPLFANIPPS